MSKLYYCLHDCVINKIHCKSGTIKSLEEWDEHLEYYPYPVVSWNRFFFHEMKDKKDIPEKYWGNGSHKKNNR